MSEHEIWHVKLGTGETRSGTLEQLDDAFQAGAIDENTLVRRDGTDAWITLAQAAGMEPAPPPPVHSAPVSAPPPPVTNDLDDLDENALRSSSKKSFVVAGIAAVAVFALAGAFVLRASGEPESRAAAAAVAPPPVAADLAAVTPKTDDQSATPQRTLTDEQKKALLQADQQRQDEARKKALSRPRAMPTVPSKNPFHKGGDKYDPLNSSL